MNIAHEDDKENHNAASRETRILHTYFVPKAPRRLVDCSSYVQGMGCYILLYKDRSIKILLN